jgi:transcriptional regulator with XRE-family HTH domain
MLSQTGEGRKEIGEAIVKARAARGMLQRDLAKLIGTSSSALSLIEAGKRHPLLSTIHKIADALGLEYTYCPRSGCRFRQPR